MLVTHHVDEIPPGFTHALLLRQGRVLAAGPLATTLTEANLSECFGLPLRLERAGRPLQRLGAADQLEQAQSALRDLVARSRSSTGPHSAPS